MDGSLQCLRVRNAHRFWCMCAFVPSATLCEAFCCCCISLNVACKNLPNLWMRWAGSLWPRLGLKLELGGGGVATCWLRSYEVSKLSVWGFRQVAEVYANSRRNRWWSFCRCFSLFSSPTAVCILISWNRMSSAATRRKVAEVFISNLHIPTSSFSLFMNVGVCLSSCKQGDKQISTNITFSRIPISPQIRVFNDRNFSLSLELNGGMAVSQLSLG